MRDERQGPPADLKARLLAAAAREPATRPGAWARRLAVTVGLGGLWLVALLMMLGVRRDWAALPGVAWASTVLGLAGAAVVASALALRRGRTMVGAGAAALSVALCGVPVVLTALVAVVDPCAPVSAATAVTEAGLHAPAGLLAGAVRCVEITVLAGAPLVGLGLMLLRGLTVSRPVAVGACLGLGAATWAHLLVRLHCSMGGVGHAVVAHLLPAVPLMIVSAWALWALDRRDHARRVQAGGRSAPGRGPM